MRLFLLATLLVSAFMVGVTACASTPRSESAALTQPARSEAPIHGAGSPEAGGASPVAVLGAMVAAQRVISGRATWYCLSGRSVCTRGYRDSDMVAAIDTDLGFEKGDRIEVRHRDRAIVVEVVDVCGCPGDRLVDLTHGAFSRLGDPALGWLPVTLRLAGSGATLPPTSTSEGE